MKLYLGIGYFIHIENTQQVAQCVFFCFFFPPLFLFLSENYRYYSIRELLCLYVEKKCQLKKKKKRFIFVITVISTV